MLSFDPTLEKTTLVHSLLLGAIAPRPIAFASTIDKEGRPNLSPFSFFNVFSAKPPIAVFSPARRVRDNTTKHTLENVAVVEEVVINVVNYPIVQQASLSSVEYPKGVNEFIKAGLTPIASEKIRPFRVKESPVQLECKVLQVIPLGENAGAGNLVVCEVVLIHVDENVMNENGMIDPHKIDLVARMGGDYYCRASGDAVFTVPKPNLQMGIGVDAIPEAIRNSTILSGNDLGKLGNIEALPNEEELKSFNPGPNALNISSNSEERHRLAKEYLAQNLVKEAWMLLLSHK